jgi:hypothetical protein
MHTSLSHLWQRCVTTLSVKASSAVSTTHVLPTVHFVNYGSHSAQLYYIIFGENPPIYIHIDEFSQHSTGSREERVSSVFRPSLSAPTMTLEEFGDQQKAEAEERSRKENSQESNVVKRSVT